MDMVVCSWLFCSYSNIGWAVRGRSYNIHLRTGNIVTQGVNTRLNYRYILGNVHYNEKSLRLHVSSAQNERPAIIYAHCTYVYMQHSQYDTLITNPT